jgi:hypothetical protein
MRQGSHQRSPGSIETPDVADVPPPPRDRAEQPKGNLQRNLITLAIIIVVVLVLGRACGGGTSSSNPGAGQTFTSDNYAELATDPDSFKGASVDVEGKLLKNPEVKGSQTSFQMWADPKNNEWNTVVHADSAPSSLSSGDMARVKGKVRGAFQGSNAFGANITATEVDADSVEVTQEGR